MQWSLIRGEEKTGVSAFWLEEGLDSGPIAHHMSVDIAPHDDVVSLQEKLVPLGLKTLEQVMTDVASGKIVKEPQQGIASLAPQLKKEDGVLDWSASARDIVNLVRGVRKWPGATTKFQPSDSPSKLLKVYSATVESDHATHGNPGTLLDVSKSGIVVAAAKGEVRLVTVQPEGKKEMSAWDFWQGAHLKIGDHLG